MEGVLLVMGAAPFMAKGTASIESASGAERPLNCGDEAFMCEFGKMERKIKPG
jgi:hypothetical protein